MRKMSVVEIKEAMKDRTLAVAQRFLPDGRMDYVVFNRGEDVVQELTSEEWRDVSKGCRLERYETRGGTTIVVCTTTRLYKP